MNKFIKEFISDKSYIRGYISGSGLDHDKPTWYLRIKNHIDDSREMSFSDIPVEGVTVSSATASAKELIVFFEKQIFNGTQYKLYENTIDKNRIYSMALKMDI